MTAYLQALESQLLALETAKRFGYQRTSRADRVLCEHAIVAIPVAGTFFWSQEIADALLASAATLPNSTTMDRGWPIGNRWYHFQQPLPFSAAASISAVLVTFDRMWDEGEIIYMLVVTSFGYVGGLFQPVSSVSGVDVFREGNNVGFMVDQIRKGQPQSDDTKEAQNNYFRDVANGYFERMIRFVIAAFLWTEQTMIVAPSEPVERHLRKRAARLGVAPEVHVVRLRRQTSTHTVDQATATVEWSCQWFVRGHWRQQYHPSTRQHKPLWILPYLKGPDDKPLKPPAPTVFAVMR